MITSFILFLFSLPKKIWNLLLTIFNKIKEVITYLFVPKDRY